MAGEIQKRQAAMKLWIADLLSGQYVKEEGWTPNYVLTQSGRKVSRVNLIGAVVSLPTVEANYRNLMLDDGTGKVAVRSFDEADPFQGVGLGDVVFVIGRPREYSSELYIMPEIVKKVQNKLWIEARKLELGKPSAVASNFAAAPEAQKPAPEQPAAAEVEEIYSEPAPNIKKVEEAAKELPGKGEDAGPSAAQKVYSMIKQLDSGDGADTDQVISKSGAPEAENIISQLLMEGEIFELGKGKLKVLE
jgi:RPA family protein